MGSDMAQVDIFNLLEFGAVLSLNLAIFNALPLPGLDGWTMTLLAGQGLFRRRISEEAKENANALAFLLFFLAFSRVFFTDLLDSLPKGAAEALSLSKDDTSSSSLIAATPLLIYAAYFVGAEFANNKNNTAMNANTTVADGANMTMGR
eukprot:gnl/MRDRNA2_/MRDRNA2_23912_c0_seq1.p2 gnl/MRDRNA2_/MRDRNA2_23912_c0~~gnl/MRDRNA2_/MRDRNA2_23912_c0_seq1.p2  ORF type:complete len:149 (+),score=31.31 gnl/MRDRNA2_/MRDRNA2_23912_c0_seq1:505-951(+)